MQCKINLNTTESLEVHSTSSKYENPFLSRTCSFHYAGKYIPPL